MTRGLDFDVEQEAIECVEGKLNQSWFAIYRLQGDTSRVASAMPSDFEFDGGYCGPVFDLV